MQRTFAPPGDHNGVSEPPQSLDQFKNVSFATA
jgi:hypothetical protein